MNRDILFVNISGTPWMDLDMAASDALLKISRVIHRAFNYKVVEMDITLFPENFEEIEGPEPIGKQGLLSGQCICQMLDKMQEQDIAPVVCGIVDPIKGMKLINACYKTLNKYGVVNCMVVNDVHVSDYMYHEVAHAIHEVIARQGIYLPDTQDQDVLGVGDSTTPAHQELVAKNLTDCIPHIDLFYTEPKEGKLSFLKKNLIILLLQKVIALMKLLPRKKDNNYGISVIRDTAKKYSVDAEVLLATIYAESRFDPTAYHGNGTDSCDYGICQINNYGGIGPMSQAALKDDYYFPDVKYVIDHPEECIDGMASQGQKGRQRDWCAYANGSYKKFIVDGKFATVIIKG